MWAAPYERTSKSSDGAKTSRADCADPPRDVPQASDLSQCHHRALLVDAAAAAASAADAHTVPCMVSAMKWLWGGATLCTPRIV